MEENKTELQKLDLIDINSIPQNLCIPPVISKVEISLITGVAKRKYTKRKKVEPNKEGQIAKKKE